LALNEGKDINQILRELECNIREQPVDKKKDIPKDLCNIKDESIESDDEPTDINEQRQQADQQLNNEKQAQKKTQQCINELSKVTDQLNNDADNLQKSSAIELKLQELVDNYNPIIYYYEKLYNKFSKIFDKIDPDSTSSNIVNILSEVVSIDINEDTFLSESIITENLPQSNQAIIQNSEYDITQKIKQYSSVIDIEDATNTEFYGLKFTISNSPFITQTETQRSTPDPVQLPENTTQPDQTEFDPDVDKRSEVTTNEISIDITQSSFENGDIFEFFNSITGFEFNSIYDESESIQKSGVLNNELYNKLQDPINELFTPEERGLSLNKNDVDPELQGTDAQKITLNNKEFYIADFDQFQRFFNNPQSQIEEKISQIRSESVSPKLDEIKQLLDIIVDNQIALYIQENFSKTTTSTDHKFKKLSSVTQLLESIYNDHSTHFSLIKDKLEQASEAKSQSENNLQQAQDLVTSIECFKQPEQQPQTPDNNGEDMSSGFNAIEFDSNNEPVFNGITSSTSPVPTQKAYWEKLCELATQLNLLPLPDLQRGGIRYWPIGLIIGGVKIPLPVIWRPISVIPTATGIIVIFLNQCGILPTPLVMVVDSQQRSQFILTLRGPTQSFSGEDYLEEIPKPIRISTGIGDGVYKDRIKIPQPNISQSDSDQINKGDSIDNLLKDIQRMADQSIEKAGQPQLTKTNNVKSEQGKEINNKSNEYKKDLIQQDFAEYMDQISLPTIKIPQDESKFNPKLSNVEKIIEKFEEFQSLNFSDETQLNLKKILLSKIDDININELNLSDLPTQVDINTNLDKIKQKWKTITNRAINKLKSEEDISSTLKEIDSAIQDLSIDSNAVGVEPPDFSGLVPQVEAKIQSVQQAVDQVINSISAQRTIQFVDSSTINIGAIKQLLKELVRDQVPNIGLPSDLQNFSFDKIFNNKIKAALKNPKIQLPYSSAGVNSPIARPIPIDLNLIKSEIKDRVASSIESKTNITDNLYQATQADFKAVFKQEIMAQLESVVKNSKVITQSFNILSKFPSATAANLDPERMIKINADPTQLERAKFAAEYALGIASSITDFIQFVDSEQAAKAIEEFQNSDAINYIATAAAASTSPKAAAAIIAVHPVLNYEDLPPWERLSLDNYLFVLYLDKLCHNGKIKGGFFENP
jgi:hypothetical protein